MRRLYTLSGQYLRIHDLRSVLTTPAGMIQEWLPECIWKYQGNKSLCETLPPIKYLVVWALKICEKTYLKLVELEKKNLLRWIATSISHSISTVNAYKKVNI